MSQIPARLPVSGPNSDARLYRSTYMWDTTIHSRGLLPRLKLTQPDGSGACASARAAAEGIPSAAQAGPLSVLAWTVVLILLRLPAAITHGQLPGLSFALVAQQRLCFAPCGTT